MITVTIALIITIIVITYIKQKREKEWYYQSVYYRQTNTPYHNVTSDKGAYGEYLIYRMLSGYEQDGATFLFNVYLPKADQSTTEIDVIMVHHSGIYVFESKNYSGWIFGTDTSPKWTQSLKSGRRGRSQKEHFPNPLFQNDLHIKCLKNYLGGNIEQVPIYSIVTFSERCELKSITINQPDAMKHIIKRNQVQNVVNRLIQLSQYSMPQSSIITITNRLFPCTQVSNEVKEDHIARIQNKTIQNKTIQNAFVAMKSCPKCGMPLVMRTVKKGNNKGNCFYGCAGFPACRYTEKM